MNLYIWQWVSHVSASYHHEGGLAISGRTLEEARSKIKNRVSALCGALTTKPDSVIALACEENFEYVFPDAGCC